MNFNDYKEYRDYYTEGAKWLGDLGDHVYYYNKEENEVIKLPAESNLTWEDAPIKNFYSDQAEAIKKVWDNEDEYEDFDELQDALWSAEGE